MSVEGLPEVNNAENVDDAETAVAEPGFVQGVDVLGLVKLEQLFNNCFPLKYRRQIHHSSKK